MEVIFLSRSGVRLFATLMASETSRDILRFYRPKDLGFGVSVRISALGNALSLISELRWYQRRYMRGVLIEIKEDTYCSLPVARDLYYDRSVSLHEFWPWRICLLIRDNRVCSTCEPGPEETGRSLAATQPQWERIYEVWVSEDELFVPWTLPESRDPAESFSEPGQMPEGRNL